MKMLSRISLCLALALACDLHADEIVWNVQSKLKRLGYYDGVIDGQMGSQTAAAIRRYQIAEKLKVTGNMNSQTLRRLGIATPPPPPVPARPRAPVPEYVALAEIFKGGPFITMDPETQIAVIREAQRNLRLLGYYNGPIDGRPSSYLVSSLKTWQASAGFRQTGRFDEYTLKGLALMPN